MYLGKLHIFTHRKRNLKAINYEKILNITQNKLGNFFFSFDWTLFILLNMSI